MQRTEISELATLLRNDGDGLLNASSKLSLSASILSKINESFSSIISYDLFMSPFHVLSTNTHVIDNFIDLQYLFDFLQKTLALKIFSDCDIFTDEFLDIRLFRNLKLLEVHRYSLNLVKGLKTLRSQLEYVTCMRSVSALGEMLESCGADNSQGYVWHQLKEASFSHNSLHTVDESLKFAPCLQSLDLSYNAIENIEPLNCLVNLKFLNLANNKIETLPLFTGKLCNTLEVLILRNNFLEDFKEIQVFVGLKELDLRSNCLINYENLFPLTNMQYLNKLFMLDNPISYHKSYRLLTAQYLNGPGRIFLLDGNALSAKELRVMGSKCIVAEETQGEQTANPVIIVESRSIDFNQTSDMEVSATSLEVQDANRAALILTHVNDSVMQDSGFEAEPRPPSPVDSIGSAASLHDLSKLNRVFHTESDIEILSNPSQSSIEVLSNSHQSRYVHSNHLLPSIIQENCDLHDVVEELHRSL